MGVRDIKAGKAWVELGLHNTAFVRGLVAAENRLRAFGRRMSAIGNRLLMASAALSAPLVAGVMAASHLEEITNKFDVVFAGNTEAMKRWADTFGEEVGRSTRQVREFLAGTQSLFLAVGFAASEAEDLSKQITTLAIDLASFNDKADADVMDDLRAAMTGVSVRMKKYGVIVNEAAVKQELLNQGLDPTVATNQQKVMARLNIVLAGTTAAHGDAIRTAESFANQLKRLKSEGENAAAALGGALLPVLSPLLADLSKLADTFGKWIAENQELVVTAAKGIAVMAATGLALKLLGTGFTVAAGALAIFNKALVFTLAQPHVAAFVSTAVVVGLLANEIRKATTYTAQLSEVMTEAREAGDKQRAADLQHLDRLGQLAAKEQLNNKEMAEARDLIAELERHYGDLGISVDETTGKIVGFADGLKLAKGRMHELLEVELERELHQLELNMLELEKEAEGFWAQVGDVMWGGGFGQHVGSMDKNQFREWALYANRAKDIHDRLLRSKAGEKGVLTGAGQESELGEDIDEKIRPEAVERLEEAMIQRLRDLRIQAEQDEYKRTVASIKERYRLERDKAEELQADKAAYAAIDRAEGQALANAQHAHWLEIEADARRATEEQARVRARATEEQGRIRADVEERIKLRQIDANKDMTEAEKQRARLKLQYQQEYSAAVAAGMGMEGLGRIKRLYELKEGMLGGADLAETRIVGSFSAHAAKYFGRSGGEPQLKSIDDNTADANEILNRIESNTARGLVWG